jgi:molybdopterin molybdotransferase
MPMAKDVAGRNEAISVGDALNVLSDLPARKTPAEMITLESAYERILSSDIESPEDMPPFSRSAMDGYAVRSADTFGCSESVPAYLRLNGEVVMGEPAVTTVRSGDAVAIPTGGMLPEGADAVVMLEHVQLSGTDIIEILRPVAPGENVIRSGEDVSKGETVLRIGHRLRPQDIGALAGLGIVTVEVFQKPSVAILSTGDEVVPPRSETSIGQVRDINSYTLAGLIMIAGGIPVKFGIIPDNFDILKEAVEKALEACNMVLLSGGSSAGVRDMTSRILESIEPGSILFHGVAIKPGKPLIGGFVKNRPVFGLPGHPAAVTVSFINFVEPVLLKISGSQAEEKEKYFHRVRARLTKNVSSAPGREDHVRVAVSVRGEELQAIPVLGKSGLMKTLVNADGILVIPAASQGISEGEVVEIRLFRK